MNTQTRLGTKDIVTRLRRVEGQVRGIQRMLEEDRECELVLTQLMAVRAGLDQVGLMLMEAHIEKCLLKNVPADAAWRDDLREALRMWARFGLVPGAASPLEGLDKESAGA
jgi:DNA-binding FrmR family transcriptional regulator